MHTYSFEKGEKVIKILEIAGTKTATLQVIESAKTHHVYGQVFQLEDSSATFDEYGREIDPVIMGCRNEIVPLDGDEESRMLNMLAKQICEKPAKSAKPRTTKRKPTKRSKK